MTHKDKLINYLKSNRHSYCDDCLSELLDIKPRQAINQMARKLYKEERIGRSLQKECCYRCKSDKLVNFYECELL